MFEEGCTSPTCIPPRAPHGRTAYANYDVSTRLAKFVTDVNALITQGTLSATLGNKWIADAQAIRAVMNG